MRLTLKPVTAPVAEDTVWYLKVDVNALDLIECQE